MPRKAPSGNDILEIAKANGLQWKVTAGAEGDPPDSKADRIYRQAQALESARGRKVIIDGVTYDSGAEAKRHAVLLRWEAAGIISALELKPPTIRILDGFEHPSVGHVRARNWQIDFQYQQCIAPWLLVLEDFKGKESDAFHQALAFRLYFLRDDHVFVNRDLGGWYTPAA